DQHLSQISTRWTVLFAAHAAPTEAAGAARQRLFERYSRAIYRYLLAAVRDPDAADELLQEFALRLVRGDFKRAHPERGRFRDFLKTALYHLIVDHHRDAQRRPTPLTADTPEPADDGGPAAGADEEFMTLWRAELMKRAWEGLAQVERQ